MAKGDQSDIAGRLKSVLPASWFRSSVDLDSNPVLAAILAMPARVGTWLYGGVAFTKLQGRIATATGGFLDLLAWDFFRNALRRSSGQSDAAFRRRIQSEVLRPRGTRPAMRQLLLDLTGRVPKFFEPTRPADTGAWGGPGLAYGLAGGWGSMLLPKQVFIDIYRDASVGVPNVTGYGQPAGGYGAGIIEWASLDLAQSAITDADILAAVVANKPAGVTVWAKIHS